MNMIYVGVKSTLKFLSCLIAYAVCGLAGLLILAVICIMIIHSIIGALADWI